MGVVYVVGTEAGAGATAVTAGLSSLWGRSGHKVAMVRPATLSEANADAEFFSSMNGDKAVEPAAMPDLDRAVAIVESAARKAETVVVEGLPLLDATGAPIHNSVELAKRIHARVVGVQPYKSAHVDQITGQWQAAFGDTLAGLVVNRVPAYATHAAATTIIPSLAAKGAAPFALIPDDRWMLAPTVRQVADHLEASFFTWPSEGARLVDRFLIGGLLMEWGGNYFGRYENQAVIVRGGRMDIQMAALNFAMSCMVLTGGGEPPQYVLQRAEAQRVPLMVVGLGTIDAAQSLASIFQRVTVHHPAKVDRFAELLTAHADMMSLGAALGLS